MTSGERMVWAAAFVQALANDRAPEEAVVAAASCVSVMRRIACGDTGEQAAQRVTMPEERRAMLDDMLGTGENRKPARVPTHEHSFVGDGCDCALCGEGRAHYLHANGGDR